MDTSNIKKAIETDIQSLGCEVWGLELFGRKSNQTLRVYIDKEDGISVEDCEIVSKHVSKVLDVENDFSENYILEVSSPGLDRKFFYEDQYQDYLGEELKVSFFDTDSKKTVRGVLSEVTLHGILVNLEQETQEIPFSSIIQANLII